MSSFLGLLLLALTLIQAVIMSFDEFIFHHRRGLDRFERWGHVADTGLFLLSILIPIFLYPSLTSVLLYGVLAVSSCLLITKDEWIHAEACSATEQWCHSLLFILHGPILLTLGLLWYEDPLSWILKVLPLGVALWGFYQFYYWNIYYARNHRKPGH